MANSDTHIDIELLTRYFAGESTDAEKRRIDAWLDASADNRKEFDQLQAVWEKLGKTSSDRRIDLDKEWDYFNRKISRRQSPPRRVFQRYLRVAVVLLLMISAVWYLLYFRGVETIRTGLAETLTISLPDDSKVTLNSLSTLQYKRQFNRDERRVKLQGEAFFEVAENARIPFIVEVGDAEVKVLGTSFNVRAYRKQDRVEVTVEEGKVSVYGKRDMDTKVIATGGEKAEFDKLERTVQKSTNENINYAAWKTRVLVFENTGLGTVAEILSGVYHREIVFEDPMLKACTVTVSFRNKDLDTILNVLRSTLDIKIEEANGKIRISGPGC